MNIHPTAVIHPSAQIGQGCEIGPFCIIGENVSLGEGCWLQGHVTLAGPSVFGSGNRFFAYGSLGQQTQDLKYAGEPTFLEVGDGNTFREFVTVNRGTAPGAKTKIGSGCNFLAYSHIAHDCTVGDRVIFSNNGTIAGHVEVGDHAVIGGLTAVHQFCRIGAHAITGGCSKIVQDVPPYMIADGNPAEVRGINRVGLERMGFGPEPLKLLKEAYRILYRSALNLHQAVERLQAELPDTPELMRLVEFLNSSSRGVIR
ncbi:MAG: acyl-ACP--UDP-N-acetylglucosamine O-acyltransferase [Verrucomicrobia bacterium]|nr:acyl-ACP--UDP-N-acetylglucosamine O-acyltransferase [Verrucomicrobiota bacterium]